MRGAAVRNEEKAAYSRRLAHLRHYKRFKFYWTLTLSIRDSDAAVLACADTATTTATTTASREAATTTGS